MRSVADEGAGRDGPPPSSGRTVMTKQQIETLRREVEEMAGAGAGRGEFREWAEAYYFGIEDLYEVVKLMVEELEGYRQRVHEERRPRSN